MKRELYTSGDTPFCVLHGGETGRAGKNHRTPDRIIPAGGTAKDKGGLFCRTPEREKMDCLLVFGRQGGCVVVRFSLPATLMPAYFFGLRCMKRPAGR